MTETKPRGPYAKTAARRAELIAAAREVFVDHGYDDASLREIARRAGLTHRAVLYHFRDKGELLAEVLRERDAAAQRRAAELTAEGLSVAQLISRIMHDELRHPELVRLWATLAPAASRSNHPAHDYFVQRYRHLRTRIVHGLRERGIEGSLASGLDDDTAARVFLAALDGLQLQALLEPSFNLEASIQGLTDALFPTVDADHRR